MAKKQPARTSPIVPANPPPDLAAVAVNQSISPFSGMSVDEVHRAVRRIEADENEGKPYVPTETDRIRAIFSGLPELAEAERKKMRIEQDEFYRNRARLATIQENARKLNSTIEGEPK